MHCILFQIRLTNYDDSGNPVYHYVRLTNAAMDITYQGYEYQATGDLLSIGDYETTYDLTTTGVEVTLSGVDPSYLQIINEQGAFLNAPVDILIAHVPEGTAFADSATYYHRGTADTPNSEFDEANGQVNLTMETESIFGDLDRTPELSACSYANHSSKHPNDTFFAFSANASLGEETWKTDL